MIKSKRIILVWLLVTTVVVLSACDNKPGWNKEIDADAISEQVEVIVAEKIDELYDDYATYYTPNEYAILFEDYQGSFGGVGISMVEVEGRITVYGIISDSPAESSDIAAGDIIISVDGVSLEGVDTTDAASMIRGEPGTDVILELERASDGSIYQQTITRDTITSETVTGTNLEDYPGTAYISIALFNELTSQDFIDVYQDLNGQEPIDKLILDLRSNGGGDFYSCIEIAELFIPENEIVVSEKTAIGTDVYRSTSGQWQDIELVILQNAYTASASEVLIGAVWDFDNVTLVGTHDFWQRDYSEHQITALGQRASVYPQHLLHTIRIQSSRGRFRA